MGFDTKSPLKQYFKLFNFKVLLGNYAKGRPDYNLTFRRNFFSSVLSFETASRTKSEISRSNVDDCYTMPHILNISDLTLACDDEQLVGAPAGIRLLIL